MRNPIFTMALFFTLLWASPIWATIERLELSNGDVLSGLIIQRDDGSIVLEHAVLGRINVPADAVNAQTDVEATESGGAPPATSADPAAAESAPENSDAEPKHPGLFGSDFLQGWLRHVGAGFSASDGNSNIQDFNLEAGANRDGEQIRSDFSAAYFFGRSRGRTNKNRFDAELSRDWLQPDSRWFFFGQGRYDFDKFEAWDHRVAISGGPGYDLIKNDQAELIARTGFGLNRTFGSDDDRLTPELVFELEGNVQLSDDQTISAQTTVFPDVSDLGEVRAISSASWAIKMSPKGELSLKLGLENEYESDPEGDAENNDIDYFGRLGYDF